MLLAVAKRKANWKRKGHRANGGLNVRSANDRSSAVVDVTRNALKRKRRTPDELAAYFQKAEPRWEKRRRKVKHFTLAWRRRRELQIIFQHRYPGGVPASMSWCGWIRKPSATA